MPRSKTGPKGFWALKRGGPQTGPELPGGAPKARYKLWYDIRRFDPGSYSHGDTSKTGRTNVVYYLHGYHDPERVIRKWLCVNRPTLEQAGVTERTIRLTITDDFIDAWNAIKDEYEWIENTSANNGRNTYAEPSVCPLCGEEVARDVPTHIDGGRCDAV